jgi:dipeptidyl aminopeptidase/acylaminoacyl peptidase
VRFSPLTWEQRFRQDLPGNLSVQHLSLLGFTADSPPSLLVALGFGRSAEARSEIWLAGITGVRKKRILQEAEKRITFYLASPDGRYVAYLCVPHRAAPAPGGDGGKRSELWVVQAATGAKALCGLVFDEGPDQVMGRRPWIDWSSDGRDLRLLELHNRDAAKGPSGLHVRNRAFRLEVSPERGITVRQSPEVELPGFSMPSPDGSQIASVVLAELIVRPAATAATAAAAGPSSEDGKPAMVAVPGTFRVRLDPPLFQEGKFSWGPGGQWLLFTYLWGSINSRIRTVLVQPSAGRVVPLDVFLSERLTLDGTGLKPRKTGDDASLPLVVTTAGPGPGRGNDLLLHVQEEMLVSCVGPIPANPPEPKRAWLTMDADSGQIKAVVGLTTGGGEVRWSADKRYLMIGQDSLFTVR